MLRRLVLVLAGVVGVVGAFAGHASAATIDVGTRIVITPTAFALPVEVKGAVGLLGWQFDLLYDAADVQIDTACDSFSDTYCDFLTGPVTQGSFFAAGDPFNVLNSGAVLQDPGTLQQTGTLLAAQGIYGGPPPAPSGDGTIAYVRFVILGNGQSSIRVGSPSVTQVPEPSSLLLLSTTLSLLALKRFGRARRVLK